MHSICSCELMANTHPWLKSEQRQQQQQHPAAAHKAFTKKRGKDVYSFLHNTFFLFPSCPVIAKKRNMKKKKKSLLLLLLWYMRGSLDVPTLAKNKNYTVSFSSVFFSTSSSHSFLLFTNFFVLLGSRSSFFVMSFVYVLLCCPCFSPLFRTTSFGWQAIWHFASLVFFFSFFSEKGKCINRIKNAYTLCCFYSSKFDRIAKFIIAPKTIANC